MALPKTIFITAGGGRQIPRYFLRRGICRALVERGVRIILLVEAADQDAYIREFGSSGVIVVGIPPVLLPWWYDRAIVFSRAAFFAPQSKYWHWIEEYLVHKVSISRVYLNRIVAWIFGTFSPLAKVVQKTTRNFILRKLPVPDAIQDAFVKYKPDLVFATSIKGTHFDIPVLMEAKRRSIKTAATVRGWDALSNIGFLLFHPDHMILQSQYLKETAIWFNFYPESKISVIGFPHFDWYRDESLIMPRDEFLRTLGIDPPKRMILFGAGSGIFHEREIAFAEMFEEMAQKKLIPDDLILVFRMHPYYVKNLGRLDHMQYVIPDRIRARELPGPGDPEADLRDIRHQINSIYHAEMLVTLSGTIIIDTVSFDKPIMVLAFDGKKKYPYRRSLVRLQDGTSFDWASVGKCGGYRKVTSEEDFAREINEYLKNPSRDASGRACIRKRFVEPLDGQASARLVEKLISIF